MTAPGPSHGTHVREQVSPELALVDPDLAGHLRAELPPPPGRSLDRTNGRVRADRPWPPAAGGAAPKLRTVPPAESRLPPPLDEMRARARSRRRRWARRVAATAVLVLLGGLGVAVAVLVSPSPLDRTASRGSAASGAAPRTLERPSLRTGLLPPSTPSGAVGEETVVERQPTRPRAVSRTPRVFAWAPVPAAAYYLVDLYRGRTRIYESRPTEARLTLPSRWTFDGHRYRLEPGRYRWTVRVGLGRPSAERYGEAVVEATLVVPKAR